MPLTGLRILLAEDNPTNQLVAVQMLESLGAQVTLAVDGVEAVEKARAGEFDLGLIDIEMPRLSGIDVIRQIRSEGAGASQLVLVAMTAYVMPDHRAAIMKAGAAGLISKPILSITGLGNEILSYLGNRAPAARTSQADDSPAAAEPAARADGADDGGIGDGASRIDEAIYSDLETTIGSEAMIELLGKVESDLQRVDDGIRSGLEDNDTGQLRDATHILVSVAGAIGAVRLQHAAQRLNDSAHAEDGAAIRANGATVRSEIGHLLVIVRARTEG